ncbi:MAG: hypothetical protein AAF725_27550, partial [Acidobacteriota bacterium]
IGPKSLKADPRTPTGVLRARHETQKPSAPRSLTSWTASGAPGAVVCVARARIWSAAVIRR